MKKGEVFQFDHQWWTREGAKTLPKTGLGDALKKYDAAWKRLQEKGDADSFNAAMKALEEADAARSSAIKQCVTVIHKETKEALARSADAWKQETSSLVKMFSQGVLRILPSAEEDAKTCGRLIVGLRQCLNTMESDWNSCGEAQRKEKANEFNERYRQTLSRHRRIGVVLSDQLPQPRLLESFAPSIAARIRNLMTFRTSALSPLRDLESVAKDLCGDLIQIKPIN